MSERKFLKPWQVTDKIIEWFFYHSYFTFYMTQMIIRFSKFTNGYEGMCMSGGKFS